jgi:hypothetical protein
MIRSIDEMYGLGDAAQPQQPQQQASIVVEEAGIYAYQRTLTALQNITDDSIIIDGDADFLLLALCGTHTGEYKIRIRPNQGRYISNTLLQRANLVGTGQFPIPLPKPLIIPSRGRIGIDILDTSGLANTVEICFIGLKRYQQ